MALPNQRPVSALMAQKPEQLLGDSAPVAPTRLVSSTSDAELAERLQRDDPWAKEALYRKYVQSIWGLALRLTGNRADAEDVVQDAFAMALRDAKQVRDPSALRAWLVSVTVHQAHRRFRRRRMLRALGFDHGNDTALLEAAASNGVSSEVMAELALLNHTLDQLAAKERMAWTLRFVEGYSLAEVAEYCRCSLATAKRRITAAQRRVSDHVDIGGTSEVGDV